MTALFVLYATLLAQSPESSPQAPTLLADIMTQLEAAEGLYGNHDVQMRIDMRLDEALIERFKTPPNADFTPKAVVSASNHREIHFVSQQPMFRLDRTGSTVTVNGDTLEPSFEQTDAFDGQTQRLLTQHAVANIRLKPQENHDRFWPHTLLLSHAYLYGPLSLLLLGNDAVLSSPYSDQLKSMPGVQLVASLGDEEDVDSLRCRKVTLAYLQDGNESVHFDLWLALDRNLIPARMWQFLADSSTKPSAVAEVSRWHEVRPAVWCPAEFELTVYDNDALRERNEQVVSWTQTTVVDEVSLEPNHSREYFSDVTIPDGVQVYEFDAQGRATVKYKQGEPPQPATPAGNLPAVAPAAVPATLPEQSIPQSWLWIGLNVLALAAVITLLIVRRRSRTPQ